MNPWMKSVKKTAVVLTLGQGLVFSQLLIAQTGTDPSSPSQSQGPVHVTRQPAPPNGSSSPAKNAPGRTQTQELNESYRRAASATRKPPHKQPPPAITGEISVTPVPGDRPGMLPPNAQEAIRLQADWKNSAKPMISPDGMILYQYGQGQPELPCAMTKVCTIEFEPGELIANNNSAEIGDPYRWKVALHQIMRNGHVQCFVTVSPQYGGSDTSLAVFTNVRAYHIRLFSDQTGWVERLGFVYPVDPTAALRAEQERSEKERLAAESQRQRAAELEKANTAPNDDAALNKNYTVKVGKHAEYLRPVLVGDNGAHTKIILNETARFLDKPSLVIENVTGPDTPPWRYDAQKMTFTVDGLFKQASLVVGGNKKKQLVVKIVNKSLGS